MLLFGYAFTFHEYLKQYILIKGDGPVMWVSPKPLGALPANTEISQRRTSPQDCSSACICSLLPFTFQTLNCWTHSWLPSPLTYSYPGDFRFASPIVKSQFFEISHPLVGSLSLDCWLIPMSQTYSTGEMCCSLGGRAGGRSKVGPSKAFPSPPFSLDSASWPTNSFWKTTERDISDRRS